MTIRTPYQWLLLAAVVLGVYYPAIFGGYSPVDDLKILQWMNNLETYDFTDLFFLNGGYYYRPLTLSTFMLDQIMWGAEAVFMHVENLLLHLLNASLVFAIARGLCRRAKSLPPWLPLLGSLLFALHPLNAEAVCWISGRYDLLATSFVLFSLWLLVWALKRTSLWRQVPALLCALLGCLAKEPALFFFGGAVLMVFERYRRNCVSPSELARNVLPSLIFWSVGALAYLAFRYQALSGRDTGVHSLAVSVTNQAGVIDWLDQLRIVVKVSGFYLKKVFFPYPLNFSIVDISDYYLVAGVVFVLLCGWLLRQVWRAKPASVLSLTGILVWSSALLVVFGHMAWTPVAERYLYMSTAFLSLALISWLASLRPDKVLTPAFTVVFLLLVPNAALTVERALIWSDPVALAEDTVAKSPNFLPARKDLANYYLVLGQADKGRKLLESLAKEERSKGYLGDDLSLAWQLSKEGQLERAHEILLRVEQNPGKQLVKVLDRLLDLNRQRLTEVADDAAMVKIRQENIRLFVELRRYSDDPFIDYRLAKEYLALHDDENAEKFFERAYRLAPESSYYREPARKLAVQLRASKHD
jgi:tetratricopeptide (TPR) repeat protein